MCNKEVEIPENQFTFWSYIADIGRYLVTGRSKARQLFCPHKHIEHKDFAGQITSTKCLDCGKEWFDYE